MAGETVARRHIIPFSWCNKIMALQGRSAVRSPERRAEHFPRESPVTSGLRKQSAYIAACFFHYTGSEKYLLQDSGQYRGGRVLVVRELGL